MITKPIQYTYIQFKVPFFLTLHIYFSPFSLLLPLPPAQRWYILDKYNENGPTYISPYANHQNDSSKNET